MHEGWEQTPQMVLIDFGIAKQVPNDVATATVTSNPGTELFMAPEYADKKVCHFDEKSEVFSIGAVMTCLITGSLSLLALGQAKDCDSQILFDQRDNTGGEWPDDVAMEFANIISRCNSVDPIKRPTVKNLVAAIKNVRALNGELGRLSPEAINRVQTHISLSQKSRLPESKTRNACARCGLDRCHGINCPDFHLVCTESTCLENMARSQMGSSTFRCPGKDCRNEFLLANLYGHINPDLYNELLMAKNQDDNAAFLMNGITSLIQALHDDFNGMVQLGLSEVKAEIRTSKDEMLLAMASQWTLVHHDTVVAQASIDQSIKHLKHYAEWLDRKESHLESQREKLSELEMNGAGNKDDIEKQLQEISTKLENLSLQNAKGVAYLASGRLQCPRLFILWPFRGPRRLRARRLIYKEYRLFFICEYDKTLVETSVTIKHVRAWLQKVAPFLKFAIFSIRVLVTVYGVPIPKLPDFIPGTNGEEKFNEVAEHMEKLLSDADSQALRSLNNFLEECSDCLNGDKLHALIREFEGDIPEEAYGALATIAYKPKNRGWMSEMEIANRGSEYAWVKKKNVEAFQSGTAVPQKFC
jgi:serine/threonine protein kinase